MTKLTAAKVELMIRIADALQAAADAPRFDRASGGYGLEVGIVASCLHPEWSQAMFLELHPTRSDREGAAKAIKAFVGELPITVARRRRTPAATEQEAQP